MRSRLRSTMRHLDRDARRLSRSFEPSPEQRMTAAVCRLFTALEAEADGGSNNALYRSVLIRHGENLSKAGGTTAMQTALEAVCAARPEQATERRATITTVRVDLKETTP